MEQTEMGNRKMYHRHDHVAVFFSRNISLLAFHPTIAKKESRLKFYRMSFALHSIDICIFFMLSLKYENK